LTAPVFLADGADLSGDVIVLTGPEGRHAATVRRIRPGERADVTDGKGLLAQCVVTAAAGSRVELRVQARREVPAPEPRISVVQALAKGDRAELAVETMTEVGVDVIVPWEAERSVARWPADRAAKSLARWRSAAREASKQARRPRMPEVTEAASSAGVATLLAGAVCAIVLEPGAARALSRLAVPSAGDIVLVVGPEGGISPVELAAFADAGAIAARLGESVLRTSTAGAVAAAVLMTATGRW
jgi:16S rRNA (uracil1498-N3)-methyltransferase